MRVQHAYFVCDAHLYAIYFDIVAAEAEIEALAEELGVIMEEDVSFDERGRRIVSQAERDVRADLQAANNLHAACKTRQTVWMCEFIALALYWQELEDRIAEFESVG